MFSQYEKSNGTNISSMIEMSQHMHRVPGFHKLKNHTNALWMRAENYVARGVAHR